MVSTYTPNLAVEKPGSGDYAGTWDAPLNSDLAIFDLAIGTIQSISLAGGSVTLSTAQARSAFLNFNGALPSNVTVTIPGLSSAPGTTISGHQFTIQNQCSNSSAFTVTLATTVAGQQSICAPPYEPFDILVEGTNSSQAGSVKFRNLGRVGSFWDYGGSSVPAWVSGCTIPPYLNCDGATFSAVTYPALAVVLGSTTLPDARGRARFTLNQGQSRITSGTSTGGLDGNTNFASGGAETVTLSSQNMPPVLITDPGHPHNSFIAPIGNLGGAQSPATPGPAGGSVTISTAVVSPAVTGITAGSTFPTNFTNIPPAYVGGLTMIRSA